jgi:hypothetical protein
MTTSIKNQFTQYNEIKDVLERNLSNTRKVDNI